MSQAHKGSRLILIDQLIPVRFDSAHFDFNEDAIGIQNGNLMIPISEIYTKRPLEGKFGGGIAIEEGTINLNTISDSGWGINKSNYQGTVTVTSSDYDMFTTSARFDFKPRLDPSGSGWQVAEYRDLANTYDVSLEYSLSFYVRSFTPDLGDLNISIRDGSGINIIMNYVAYQPESQWSRFITTFTPLISGNSPNIYITANNNHSFEIADPQIEQKPFATSFVNGARASSDLIYNNNGIMTPQSGFINIWVEARELPDINWRMIFVMRDSVTENNQIRLSTNNTWDNFHWKFTSDNVNRYEQNIVVTEGWHMFTISWDKSIPSVKTYCDGQLISEGTDILSFPSSFYDQFHLGYWGSPGGMSANHLIDELTIGKYMPTDDEVESWFVSESPFYNPYDYRSYAY